MITKMVKFLCLVSGIAHVSSKAKAKHEDEYYNATVMVNINGVNLPWTLKSESAIKYNVDEARFYFFDQEIVNATCTSVIYNVPSNKKFLLRLSTPDKNNPLEFCSKEIQNSSTHALFANRLLTSATSEFTFSCSVMIGERPCSRVDMSGIDQKILRVVHFKLAKLRIYINDKEMTLTKENEVIYGYDKENVTIKTTCSHGQAVYTNRNFDAALPVPATWKITEKLNRNFHKNVRNNGQNSLVITLFAGLHGTYIDCVENLGNRVPLATPYRPSKIRLRFIYETGNAKPGCDPDDDKKAEEACGKRDICITYDGTTVTEGQPYKYNDLKTIQLGCHFNLKLLQGFEKDYRIHWKKNDMNLDDYVKCRNLDKTISLLADNTTVFTCEAVSENSLQTYKTNIAFYYQPQTTTEEESSIDAEGADSNKIPGETKQSFLETHWILLTAATVIILVLLVALVISCYVFNSRKLQKEDKTRLNPKGSRDCLNDIPTGNIPTNHVTTSHIPTSHRLIGHSTPLAQPKLQEFYTNLGSDNASEVYCDPYQSMYTQPIPKSVRKPPKITPRNQENHSNPHKDLSNYNKTDNLTGTMYNNLTAKNTGTMYHYIDNRNKNTEQVHLYDNGAAGYSNTTHTNYYDAYSEPGLYDVPS